MHSRARAMQPPGFSEKDPWICGQRPRRANDTMATALVWRGSGRPRRRDGSPGGQKPYRRSPGRVDLSAREVRRGAVPAREVVSLALRPRGLLAGLSHLTAVGCRRGARIPRRGEVPAIGRAVHLRREPARRSLALPHDAPPLAPVVLHPRHRASRRRPLVLPGARLRDRPSGRAVPPVRPQPRRPRGARPPDLQLAHRVASASLSLASKTPKGCAPTTFTPSTPSPTMRPITKLGVPPIPARPASVMSFSICALNLSLARHAWNSARSRFSSSASALYFSAPSWLALTISRCRISQNLSLFCSPAQRAAMAALMALGCMGNGRSRLTYRILPVST